MNIIKKLAAFIDVELLFSFKVKIESSCSGGTSIPHDPVTAQNGGQKMKI